MTVEQQREAVEECINMGALTKWEDSFITSISDKLERGQALTEREQEKLEQIYDKVRR